MQIREIFNLFDPDGVGTIDKGELDFAMSALGFHVKSGQGWGSKEANDADEAQAAMEEIAADGYVHFCQLKARGEIVLTTQSLTDSDVIESQCATQINDFPAYISSNISL